MTLLCARLVLSLVAALVGGHLLAQETQPQNPVLGLDTAMAEPPAFEELLTEGHTHLYNLDFEQAIDTFERSMVFDPMHPGPYAWQATTLWLQEMLHRGDLELDGYVDVSRLRRDEEGDAEDDTRDAEEEERRAHLDEAVFLLVEEGLSRAQQWLETEGHELRGIYYRGLLLGIRAGYRAAVMDETVGAIGDAKAAVSLHEQVLAAAPTFVDAFYSLGVYNYVAGTFPWYVKLVSYFAGGRGDADEGRRLLERVAQTGTTLRDAARVTLAVSYLREDEPRRSAELLAQLAERYPRNYLFAQNRAFALGRACEWDTAVDLYAPLLGRVEANTPNYHLADPLVLRLNWGHAAIQAVRAPTARSVYSRLLGGDAVSAWTRALAYLGRGQAYDLLGERDAALADYRSVLEAPNVEDSHDRAEQYVNDRYRPPERRSC